MTPDEFTNSESFLAVGDGHELYIHDWGNSKVKTPIVLILGGPGSSAQNKHKQLFDPKRERVVFYDQRGCGRSLPFGSLEHNTTQDSVEDIEKIAKHLKLKQFVLTGGSWGCTLALAYAVKYPKRISAMVLNGIFTGSQSEINWLDKGQFRNYFPDIWDQYLAATPKSHQHDPSAYHFKRILGDDSQAVKVSAYAYANLESALIQLDDRYIPIDFADYDPTGTRMEILYLANRCFMPDRYIFNNVSKLTMPIWLVQGRYDMACPPITAYELNQKLPNSQLIWTVSGHKNEREAWNVSRQILLQLTGAAE